MGEDMTYTAEPTRAQLAARVAELERENAELRAKLDAVPVDAILTLYDGTPRGGWIVPHLDTVGDWLIDVCPNEMGPEMEPR